MAAISLQPLTVSHSDSADKQAVLVEEKKTLSTQKHIEHKQSKHKHANTAQSNKHKHKHTTASVEKNPRTDAHTNKHLGFCGLLLVSLLAHIFNFICVLCYIACMFCNSSLCSFLGPAFLKFSINPRNFRLRPISALQGRNSVRILGLHDIS
jgi:hypothetical protein